MPFPGIASSFVPITAARMRSLLGDEGRMFSSLRTPPADLSRMLGHMSAVPSLVLMGSADEYVADGLDATTHVSTLLAAMVQGPVRVQADEESRVTRVLTDKSHEGVVFPGANHSFEGHEEAMATIILSWLAKLPGLA